MDDDIPEDLMQIILQPLIDELLPLVGNDKDRARDAAEAAAHSFDPKTGNEFRLAVRVALHNILGNRLTSDASGPDLTPACAVRMHRCALAYIREADKAERRLYQLQAERSKEDRRPERQEPEPAPEDPPSQSQESSPIPAYKRLKQERRLARQREREARKALVEAWAADDPGLPRTT